MEKTRRHFTLQQKVAILREHLLEHVPVSDRRAGGQAQKQNRCFPRLLRNWCAQKKELGESLAAAGLPMTPVMMSSTLYQHSGTFFYLCSLLDGCSRAIVYWELCEAIVEADVEIFLQSGLEKYPHAKPRIISDNSPQFIARQFERVYPHRRPDPRASRPATLRATGKSNAGTNHLKPIASDQRFLKPPRRSSSGHSLRRTLHHLRLHSAIGYINPADKLAGKEEAIFVARDQKLLQARETRKTKRNENNIHSLAVTPDETKNHGPQGVRGRSSDNTLLRDVLKWEPQVSLEEGLAVT